MTRAQRRRHLAIWCVVGPGAMLLIIVALAVRPSRIAAGEAVKPWQPAESADVKRGLP